MDLGKLELPKKDAKTPKKEPGKLGSESMPSSPERDLMVKDVVGFFEFCRAR